MSQQQRIARNTILAIVGVAAAGIVRFTFAIATGRAFGSAVLGDIAVILAVATIATIPAAGIGSAGNRFLAVASGASDKEMRSATLGATWRGAVFAIGAAVAGSWIYLTLQGAVAFDTVSLLLGLAFVASYGLYLTGKGVLFGDGKADRYAVGEVIGVVGFVVSLMAVLSTSLSPGWVLGSQVLWAMGVVAVGTMARVGPTSLRGRAPKGLWPFAATATVGSLVSLGVTQATVLVMAAAHGSEQAGLLAAALAITAPLYLLPRGLSLALTPSMSFHIGAGSDDRANLETTYTTTLLVLFGGVAAASIIALSPVVLSVYGREFSDAATFVAIIAIASFIAVSGIPVVNRFVSQGTSALRLTVIASAIGAAAAAIIWATVGRTDPTWIAIGFLVASISKVAIPFALSHRVTGTWIVPSFGITAVASAGVASAFLPTPWQFVCLTVLVLTSVVIVFISTVRYRAHVAWMTSPDRPLTLGVLTNMYPLPDVPSFGIFVHDRVAAYEATGAEVVITPPKRKTGTVKYIRLAADALIGLVTEPVPDVYEVHPTQPTGVIALFVTWIAERPYVLYAHGADVAMHQRFGFRTALDDQAVKHASEIHTNSEYMADMVMTRWPAVENISVIPPGVRMPEQPPSPSGRDIDVLFVGNMIPRKGVDILIEAIRLMPGGQDLGVVIAGDGPELGQLREQARAAGLAATFLGAIAPDTVGSLMARAKVVAVPSRDEPLGQVAVEALAQGTPIVVSATGGLASTPNPRCGSVVPPEDPGALAGALARWATMSVQERTEASEAARERAEDFAIENVASDAVARFEQVARRDRLRGHGSEQFSGPRID